MIAYGKKSSGVGMAREFKACALALVPPSRIPKSLLGILDSLSEGNFSLCPTFEKKSANKIQAAAAAATSAATGLAMPAEPQADVKVMHNGIPNTSWIQTMIVMPPN